MNYEPDKIHILIVDDDPAEVDNIKVWLGRDMRVPWGVVHCVKLTEVLPRTATVDLIILKPEMQGFVSPEDVFRNIEDMVFEIPIIVLTNADAEHSMSTYVMEKGAADVVIRGQFARLVDAIEFALIRQRLTTRMRKETDHTLSESQHGRVLDEERHKQIIRMLSGDYSVDHAVEKAAINGPE